MSYMLMCLLLGPLALGLDAYVPNGLIVPPVTYREPLPASLSLEGHAGVTVYDSIWFSELFPSAGKCSRALTRNEVRVHAAGGNLLSVSVNGLSSWLLASGEATYVPVHSRMGHVVHPYFVVRTPGWVKFHVEIRTAGGRRTLRVSLIRGRPGVERLVPVFSAVGL